MDRVSLVLRLQRDVATAFTKKQQIARILGQLGFNSGKVEA